MSTSRVVLESDLVLRCVECGQTWHYSDASAAADHPCVDDDDPAARTGRCEDYPACGHRAGECGSRAEYTAAYWRDLHASLGDEQYERYCEALDRQEGWY